MNAVDCVDSPVGALVLGATEAALCRLEFCAEPERAERVAELMERCSGPTAGAQAVLADARRQLEEYFARRRSNFALPVVYEGTAFQHRVWTMLLQIPYGQTWSYAELAARVGDPTALRAVGAANGANPIAIVIPCHRVINANGELGGYGGGSWRKRLLLSLEQGQMTLDL